MGRPKGSGNPDLHKTGKKFSKENQPPPRNKGPRWRKRLKAALEGSEAEIENAVVKEAKAGNMKAVEWFYDRAYGKLKDEKEIKHTFGTDEINELKDIYDKGE